MAVSYSGLVVGTTLAASDKLAWLDVSDLSQSVNGSVLAITITNFFATVPAPVNITSASATSLAVGRLGATTPAFTVDSSTASQVAGLKVTGAATGGTVAVVVTDSGAAANLTINALGTGTIGIGSVSTGRVTITPVTTITGLLTLTAGVTGPLTVTSSSASSLAVGLNGATNPAFVVDSSTASQAAGLSVTGAVAAGTVAVAVVSSGAAANLSVDAKGTGTITLGGTSTGAITLTRATTLSAALTYGGVTLSNAVTGTGNMVLSASPTFTGTVVAAAIAASGNITTTANLAAGTATATYPLTVHTGVNENLGIRSSGGLNIVAINDALGAAVALSVTAASLSLANAGAVTFGGAVSGITTLANTGAVTHNLSAVAASPMVTISGSASTPDSTLTSVRSAGSFVVAATDAGQSTLILYSATTAAASPRLVFTRTRGTVASPSATQSGDYLGLIEFGGYTNALTTAAGAYVAADATEAWGAAAAGTRLQFGTTATGATTAAVALILNNDKSAVFTAGIALSGTTGPSNGIRFGTSAPGTLADGQMWYDGTDFKVRTGGATKTITIA